LFVEEIKQRAQEDEFDMLLHQTQLFLRT